MRKLRRETLQRGLTALLLGLFCTDLAYHFSEPFVVWSDSGTAAVLARHGSAPDPDGRSTPDPESLSTRHHHFPAVISQLPAVPLIAIARVVSAVFVDPVLSSSIVPIGRAPPLV
jgi:hypothetical protein